MPAIKKIVFYSLVLLVGSGAISIVAVSNGLVLEAKSIGNYTAYWWGNVGFWTFAISGITFLLVNAYQMATHPFTPQSPFEWACMVVFGFSLTATTLCLFITTL